MNDPFVFQAMNTDFLIAGLPEKETAEVREMVDRAESAFSRFLPDSEISRLNGAEGKWTKISTLTYDLLTDTVEAFRSTGGLFNPFLGIKLQELGYDRSFEKLEPVQPYTWKSRTSPAKGNDSKETVKLSEEGPVPIEMDFKLQQVRLLPDIAIDVGGIAKGWIAQQAANRLLAKGISQGLIDAGGDVVLWGRQQDQGVWGVGIGHPLGFGEDIADLWLEGLSAIATSSVVKRRWQSGGSVPAHHIIDPRTGVSANTDLLQATVLARDLTTAEQYAKCLIILGSKAGISWMALHRPELAYILVLGDGSVLHSDNLNRYAGEWKVNSYVELDSDAH